ncbi:hypothetical protein BJ165DRAFT_1140115 [Panaeolus papilionaceus]|nr:hypothetical protein BJ165DRAFT_1140115 [Panaeolus papilionaceus]
MKGPADIAHGPMLIGFMFNILLYGIMMTQVYIYFTTYKRDKSWMKIFVVFLLVLDTANSVFDFIYLYQSLITYFGDDIRLATANWLFATDPALTAIIASLVQGFFAWRIHVLTQSRVLVLLVAMGSVAGTIGGVITSCEVGRTPRFVDFQDFKSFVILWLVSESITDILVTTILVWHLKSTKLGTLHLTSWLTGLFGVRSFHSINL